MDDIERKKLLLAGYHIPWRKYFERMSYTTLRANIIAGHAACRTYQIPWKLSYLSFNRQRLREHLLNLYLRNRSATVYITGTEAAKRLNITQHLLRALIAAKLIRTHKLSNRRTHIHPDELIEDIFSPGVQQYLRDKASTQSRKGLRNYDNAPLPWEHLISSPEPAPNVS